MELTANDLRSAYVRRANPRWRQIYNARRRQRALARRAAERQYLEAQRARRQAMLLHRVTVVWRAAWGVGWAIASHLDAFAHTAAAVGDGLVRRSLDSGPPSGEAWA